MAEFLYREFCNHVYLGQWELARACAVALIKNDTYGNNEKQLLLSTLKNLAKDPFLARSAWGTLPSPSYINFLSCQLWLDLGYEDEIKIWRRNADFNILLETYFWKPRDALRDLAYIYSEVSCHGSKEYDVTKNKSLEISPESISLLKKAITHEPVITCVLICAICIPMYYESASSFNIVLCNIIFQYVLNCLNSLKSAFSKRDDVHHVEDLSSKVYLLLSVLPECTLEKVMKKSIDEIFLLTHYLCKSGALEHEKVYRSLLGRPTPHGLQYYCKLEDDIVCDISNSRANICLRYISDEGNFSHRQALLSSVNSSSHFLQDLIDYCIQNIVSGNYELAWNSLQDDLLSRLKPLILILSWGRCCDDVSAANVIHVMKTWNEVNESPLNEVCKEFKRIAHLTDLFIAYYQELHPSSSSSKIQNKARNVFMQLQTHSILSILHTEFGLKNISFDKILEFLNFEQGNASLCKESASSYLTDRAIYSGYLIMIWIMEAVLLCCEYKSVIVAKKLVISDILYKVCDSVNTSENQTVFLCDCESVAECINNHGAQYAYSRFIVERLEKAKNEVKKLFPIAFRVEVLENIFSMLFLMSLNLVDALEQCSDSDQGCEGENFVLPGSGTEPFLVMKHSTETEKKYSDKFTTNSVKDPITPRAGKDTLENYSGHSSKSTESNSSNGLQSCTFLCNELITRDLLILLKDSVIEAKAEVYKAIGNSDINVKGKIVTESGQTVTQVKDATATKLSICTDDLHQRTSQLLQYISEAIWRYEIVKSDIFQEPFSFSTLQKKTPYLFQSQQSVSSSDGTDKESKRHRKKKKKHKHNFSSHKKDSFAESSIIQCMLSSPEALLRYSLWNKNLVQAGQVIKLFHLQSSSEARELTLVHELQRISKKLSESEKIKPKFIKKETASPNGEKSLLSNILAIEDAAASGLQSSEICLIINQELSSLKVPEIIDVTGGIRHPELVLGSENIYSVFLADLSCTSGASIELSSILLDMASRSWNNSRKNINELDVKVLSKKKMSLIRGNFKTLQMMNSLVKEFRSVIEEPDFHADLFSMFWPTNQNLKSFSQALFIFVGNLDCQRFQEEINNWKRASILLEEFSAMIVEEELREESGTLQKDITRENKLHMTYKKLSKVLRELRDWSSETIRPQPLRYDNYLSNLLIHLHQVTTAVLDCKKQSLDAGPLVYTSDFSILKESPVELLKKIVLHSNVTPEKIESFAVRMKVDLVHVLAQACLPHVPLINKNISYDILLEYASYSTESGYPLLVLNMLKPDWPSPRHPDLVARELMRDLLAMIQDTAMANDSSGIFDKTELLSLVEHSELLGWMKDCSELAFVNLDLLQTRQEKLAFFVNVTNIAWIHGILVETLLLKALEEETESFSSDFPRLNHFNRFDSPCTLLLSPNLLERCIMQKILGYVVGQLGPISLFDLRYQLLHAPLPVPKHIQDPPYYQLLNDAKPLWEKYMPPLESRLLFVLVEGLLYSPTLRVMYSEVIEEDLDDAMKDYFDFSIQIDLENDIISLPKLLDWYAMDFSKDDESDLDKAPYEGLINLLSTLVRSPLDELFQALLSADSMLNFSENIDSSGKKQLPFTLEFQPPLQSFGIKLEYVTPKVVHPNPDYTKFTPLMDPQAIVLNYIKEKCVVLYQLIEVARDESMPQFSEGNISFEAFTRELLSSFEWSSKVPAINLLRFYKNLLMTNDAEYSWFSSALSPFPNKKFYTHQIEACFRPGKWQNALLYIDIFLENCDKEEWTAELTRLLILEHMASINPASSSDVPCRYALCINDLVHRANTVLQNIYKWSDSFAIQALKFCLSDKRILRHPNVHNSLKTKLKEIILYKKIFDASEMYGDSDAKDCVYVFNNWQEVADCSVWDQSRILDLIKSCEKYELAVEWNNLHVVNKEQKMLALSMNLTWFLTQTPIQELEVYQILNALEDSSECISLCDMVLPELPSIESKLCLVQYLVKNDFPSDKHHHYFNMLLGLKMLSAIKSGNKDGYADLIAHPYLLLEQMLMNAELKDAEEALKAIINDLEPQNETAPIMSLSSVNQLVEDYASKALEVHFLDALLDMSSSSTLIISTEETLVSDETFIMPLRVPTKEEWVPDAKIHRCQVCKEERFNMFSRRHHCRRCGRVVCANCSQHALLVEGYGNVKVRVCDDCYNIMTGSLSYNTASFEKRYRVLSSMQSSSPRNSPYQVDSSGGRRRASSVHSNQQIFRWMLSSDSEQNTSVRNEFSYEQAPSIQLCYSLLKLHTDNKKCAQFMLNLCDRLLGKIKPRRSGKISLEIDYSLFISMIKSLLMNAKVKCHQVQDSEGEALADLYFRHLDIMKLLVNANCKHLLPREALINTDIVRKLRDKLLEEERMNLALEVSTKFNLEKTGVWSTWGLFCLKAGDWSTARIKFQQCLKVLNDKNDQNQENPLLNKILAVLENSKYPGTQKAATIFNSLSTLKNIKSGLTQFKNEISPLDDPFKKECLFYLDTYGTHFSTVRFYHRHGLIHEALEYIMEKKCDPDVFIEALFMPVLKNVQLSSLKHHLINVDLSVWSPYLFATCRHLERLKYLNVLYEVQLFMGDYIRAAKSAINFYLAPAPSYRILFERYRHLRNAKKHYEEYVKENKDENSGKEYKKRKNLKMLPVKEVESYIQVITLQEEVSSFFQLCASQNNHAFLYEAGFVDGKSSKNSYCPPTLFGNVEKKTEVALMVLLNAINTDEGFDLAIKIIQTFNLDATAILCKAGRELIRINQKRQIPHFLACVKCFFTKIVKVDEVILECVAELSKQNGDVEDIIKMLTSESNKIHAYLMCGKLKSAYLLAIKLNSALHVRRVMVAAEQGGQDSIQQFCKKWLETNSLKMKPKESASRQQF